MFSNYMSLVATVMGSEVLEHVFQDQQIIWMGHPSPFLSHPSPQLQALLLCPSFFPCPGSPSFLIVFEASSTNWSVAWQVT